MTFNEIVPLYLAYCQNTKKLEPLTLKAYRIDLGQLCNWLNANIQTNISLLQVNKTIISDFLTAISGNYKAKTLKRKIASIKALFNFLEIEDYININPFHKIKCNIKESKSLPKAITLFDIEKLLRLLYDGENHSVTQIRNLAVFEILFATGMRVSELSNVKLSDWDRNSQTFRITGKGEKERILYIGNQTVLSAIDNYIKTRPPTINNYLFINRIGERLSEQSIRFFIEKLGKTALNKHITPHMLRHSFATLLLEEGVDITYIKSFLGHSSISTTQIYASASTLRQRQILFAYHPRNRIHLSE